MITVDVLCVDSNIYQAPIWNEHQAASLEEVGLFKLNNIKKHSFGIGAPNLDLWNSDSDILISISPDQHRWGIPDDLFNKYKQTVLINDEPIFVPDAHWNAKNAHTECLQRIDPDIVYYCSNIDAKLSTAKCSKIWPSCLDVFYGKHSIDINTKEHKGILSYTKIGPIWSGRGESLEAIQNNPHIPVETISNLGYNETAKMVAASKFCFCPTHPLVIHYLRFLRSWYLCTIPIVVNSNGWLDREDVQECYADILEQNGKTCILTDVSGLNDSIEILNDEKVVNNMLSNIHKLDLSKYGFKSIWEDLYNTVSWLDN